MALCTGRKLRMPDIQSNEQTDLKIIVVSSLKEYIEKTENLEKQGWWFRGQPCASFRLLPGIYRNGIHADPNAQKDDVTFPFINNDREIIEKYLIHLKDKNPGITFLQAMYQAQHYGVQTRLLDFSADKYIGLFFAVSNPEKECNDVLDNYYEFNDNYVAVFCLNPLMCNHFSYGKDVILNLSELSRQKIYKNDTPIALEPDFDNVRIKAQSGKFILFGQFWQPLDWFNIIRKTSLIKIIIPKTCCQDFVRKLQIIGYSYDTVYPDSNCEKDFIENLNYELKRSLVCIKDLEVP